MKRRCGLICGKLYIEEELISGCELLLLLMVMMLIVK